MTASPTHLLKQQTPSFPEQKDDVWRQLTGNIFANNINGIVIYNATGSVVEVNSAFTSITGFPREEVIKKSRTLFQELTGGSRLAMWKMLRRRGVWQGEIVRKKANGGFLCAPLSIYAVYNKAHRPSHYIGLISGTPPENQRRQHLWHYDELTGLPNRALLLKHLQQVLMSAGRQRKLVAVCHLDIDAFKTINEQHGEDFGNLLLITIAERLRSVLREGDTLARLDGDGFILLLQGLESPQEIDCILPRLLQTVAASTELVSSFNLSASIGVSLFPKHSDHPEALLRHACQAMHRAKDKGRANYHLYEAAPGCKHEEGRVLHRAIRNALHSQQFRLYYQPKISLQRGSVIGVEALIRWAHPERGLLPPGDFLPAVNTPELAAAIDRWVIGKALQQMAAWANAGLQLSISVNVSAQLLQEPKLDHWLASELVAAGLPTPCRLELEILESASLPDLPRLRQLIEDCARLGVTFALDDFGTGYSSLTYLRQLPAATIKIDRSFVEDMLINPEDLAIVKGVMALAGAFGRQVVVEGVETAAHGRLLAELGGDHIQGYGISHPIPADAIQDWIANFSLSEHWQPAKRS